ncbi:MAG: 3-phosphoserine/phosphohydroxythreonine transaminase [Bacteroidetes bacterium]|nr:3-phosphoserine/phosphohydroxythreonine transaminase [Bacteroidota bacterium]
MNPRKHYFGSGPAALPQCVLEGMSEAILDYKGSGISLLSIPHRGPAFQAILDEAQELVLHLSGLSADEYAVLWMQGGGRHQFALLPMNFLKTGSAAGYIDSGHWAQAALKTAQHYGACQTLCSSSDNDYSSLPAWPPSLPEGLSYIHLTTNNTIYGTQMPELPLSPVPLFADMSSDIFSIKRAYSRCALFYAVAQKQLGAAGVTLVVARRTLLEQGNPSLPDVFSYAAQVRAGSVLNTPPVSAIYSCLLTLRWMQQQSMQTIEKQNREKAALVYAALDEQPLFHCPVAKDSRSLMNVVFKMNHAEQEQAFLNYCTSKNIEGIRGHRLLGGFRAALYNAVSLEDAAALANAIRQFKHKT